jgi:subtilase family serine protease
MRRRGILVLASVAAALLFATLSPAAGAASPRITFYFGLARPEAKARKAFFAVQQPGSATYRRFLSASRAASRYGASARTRRAFIGGIRRLGLSPSIDRSGVFARVRGTVSQFQRAFKVRIVKAFNNDVIANLYFVAGNRPLRLPRSLRPLVREVVAAYSRSTTIPRSPASPPGARARVAATAKPTNAGTWTGGCSAARATGAYSFAQVRHAYGLDTVGTGRGASAAILNAGEGVAAQDIGADRGCFGLPALRTRTLLTDGQARPFGRGSFEPQEDLDLLRGAAPGLRSLTFTQVWLDPGLWFLGAAQVLDAPRLPDTFSISYGECERVIRGPHAQPESRAGAELLDSLLARLGLVGVASFAAAGDFGSTCDGQPYAGVTWPASSPFLTAVGGTRLVLDAANNRTNEVVWNDLQWMSANAGAGAGGGGLSIFSNRPSYQRGLPVPGGRRAVPDVAAHASLFPAWPVVLAGNWVTDGGTSAATPLIAGGFAVLSARQRAAGRPPLGPVNGLLYGLRRSTPATLFDIVDGSNGYNRKVPAQHAKAGYDLASGLGVPQFAQLAASLPPPAR